MSVKKSKEIIEQSIEEVRDHLSLVEESLKNIERDLPSLINEAECKGHKEGLEDAREYGTT